MKNALCIDVDDLCLTYAEYGCTTRQIYCGVEEETEAVLMHLSELGIKATFFIPGLTVKYAPKLITSIIQQGHELASHGWQHVRLETLGPKRFKEDVYRSKTILEDMSGRGVHIYKAPSWSITPSTLWAYDILSDTGIKIDHSAMPSVKRALGYSPGMAKPFIHSSGITIIPPTSFSLLGGTIPFPGGCYTAYIPMSILNKIFRKINLSGTIFNLYFHPYEHTPSKENQKLIKAGSLRVTLTTHHSGCYRNILNNLCQNFIFDTLSSAYAGEI